MSDSYDVVVIGGGPAGTTLATRRMASDRSRSTFPRQAGIDIIWRLIMAFYDDEFSFGAFLRRFPEQRGALIDCLVGDVVDKDWSALKKALAQMTVPPQPLIDAGND